MNKKQAKSWVGNTYKLRPSAILMTEDGQRLPQEDDSWLVSEVTDKYVNISNQRTEHQWKLGSDDIREFRNPDFLLLRCQITLKGSQVLSEPLIITSVDRNLTGFEVLLKHSWVHEFFGNREVWISEVDNMFQMEVGEMDEDFDESWTQRFPDREHTFTFPVTLKVQGVEIKQLTFVFCDGGRILVPMPKTKMVGEKRHFQYNSNSLEYKVGQIIGRFYIYKTLYGVAAQAGIEIIR